MKIGMIGIGDIAKKGVSAGSHQAKGAGHHPVLKERDALKRDGPNLPRQPIRDQPSGSDFSPMWMRPLSMLPLPPTTIYAGSF